MAITVKVKFWNNMSICIKIIFILNIKIIKMLNWLLECYKQCCKIFIVLEFPNYFDNPIKLFLNLYNSNCK